MKIAVNCIFFQPRSGGIKEYIFNLVNNLHLVDSTNKYVIYVLKDQLSFARNNFPKDMCIKVVPYVSGSLIEKIKRSLLIQSFWSKEEEIEQFDVFHSPFFHSPSFKKAKVVLTVHDMRFYRYPRTYTFLRYIFLKYSVKKSIERVDHVIAISEFTKQELLKAYNIPNNKISVVHESIDWDRFRRISSDLTDKMLSSSLSSSRFLLTVGHIEPRKNYLRLLHVFNNLKKQKGNKDLKLVIVGKKAHSYKRVLELIESTPDVVYLDYVSHNILLWLYQNATLFVFPTYYEGFGFPPLEAAALGTVSVVSNVSSLPEICAESAFYFNPFSCENMTNVLLEVLSNNDSINEKKKLLQGNLSRFSWKKNALETMRIYKKIL